MSFAAYHPNSNNTTTTTTTVTHKYPKYGFRIRFTLLKAKFIDGEDYQTPEPLTWEDWKKWQERYRSYLLNELALGQYNHIYDTVVNDQVFVYQDEATGNLIAAMSISGEGNELPTWANPNSRDGRDSGLTKRSFRRYLEYVFDSAVWCDGDPTLEEWDEPTADGEEIHAGWAMWLGWDGEIDWSQWQPATPQPDPTNVERTLVAGSSPPSGPMEALMSGGPGFIGTANIQLASLATTFNDRFRKQAGFHPRVAQTDYQRAQVSYFVNKYIAMLKDTYEGFLYEYEVSQ